MEQTSSKKQPNIYQKSTENGPWSRLGAFWQSIEAPGRILRGLGSLLGGSGRLLGTCWSETEGQDGSKLGPKREVLGVRKRSENGCIIGSLLGSTCSWFLDRFWEAIWNQVGIKIDLNIVRTSKSDLMKKLCFSLGKTMIWKVAHVEVGSKIDQKTTPNRSQIDLNLGKHLDIDFS